MTLEEKAAFEQFMRAKGHSTEEINQALANLEEGRQIQAGQAATAPMQNVPSQSGNAWWQDIGGLAAAAQEQARSRQAEAGRRAIAAIGGITDPGRPGSLAGATGLSIKGPGLPPEIQAREPQPGDVYYEAPPADLGTLVVEGAIPGQSWGGGSYTRQPGVPVVGGGTVSGSGFPAIKGGPVMFGNTPQIAARAAELGLKPTTGSSGAYSQVGPGMDEIVDMSWKQAQRQSPLVQDIWQEKYQQNLNNLMGQAGLQTAQAQGRIAEQQAVEAELPFEEQQRRYAARQMALANAIMREYGGDIEAQIENEIQIAKAIFLKQGRQMSPQEEQMARINARQKYQDQLLSRWMTNLTPATLARLYQSGLVNPFAPGGMTGGMGGQ